MGWELSRRLPLKGLAIVLLLAACGAASADDFFEGHWIREEAKRRGITLISSEQARKIAVDPAALEREYAAATELWTGKPARKALSAKLAPHDAAVWMVEFK